MSEKNKPKTKSSVSSRANFGDGATGAMPVLCKNRLQNCFCLIAKSNINGALRTAYQFVVCRNLYPDMPCSKTCNEATKYAFEGIPS